MEDFIVVMIEYFELSLRKPLVTGTMKSPHLMSPPPDSKHVDVWITSCWVTGDQRLLTCSGHHHNDIEEDRRIHQRPSSFLCLWSYTW
jgi:hypothetical protein